MGREFDRLFDKWAANYDETVSGSDDQYADVFLNYDHILEAVSSHAKGSVIEFGVGTGNLTARLIEKGIHVLGIEPSTEMRKKAKKKLGSLSIVDGDFFHFPLEADGVDAFVSTYAFHHLTDDEKEKAIALYAKHLKTGGKIVFADTMFLTKEDKQATIETAKKNRFDRLAEDLRTEYYTTIPYMKSIMEKHQFRVTFTQLNAFVWLMLGIKQ
ncbi:class I SAM-dependent methyltransferase [Bacillus testis]|uniref:class I SAM-dependent methyltransferase n=1 Tax=Bacillus testis TaxID=1622072 RepID=UPI00067ED1BF|nr:class I SAM-dependent methyltransferase [Bacillus testis]